MSKKLKDRFRDSALYDTTRDHATYTLTFLTYLYIIMDKISKYYTTYISLL